MMIRLPSPFAHRVAEVKPNGPVLVATALLSAVELLDFAQTKAHRNCEFNAHMCGLPTVQLAARSGRKR